MGSKQWLGAGSLLALVLSSSAEGLEVKAPMVCSRGDRQQFFHALVTMPSAQPCGSTFTVRIDSVPSGKVSHGGLKYIHGMQTDFLLPEGTTYVEGSAHIVPESGTPNAREGAQVLYDGKGLHLTLPGHVENGSSYTPPSIEFQLRVEAAPGAQLALKFAHYSVTAHVILLGDVETSCEPDSGPYTIGVTQVEAASPSNDAGASRAAR